MLLLSGEKQTLTLVLDQELRYTVVFKPCEKVDLSSPSEIRSVKQGAISEFWFAPTVITVAEREEVFEGLAKKSSVSVVQVPVPVTAVFLHGK